LDVVAQKVADSYPSAMSKDTALEHLQLLAATIPSYCEIIPIGIKKYLRLNLGISSHEIKEGLEKAKSA
jgi:hypothetical protein